MMLFARRLRTAAVRACACSALLALAAMTSGCTESSTVTTPSGGGTLSPSSPVSETMSGVLPVGGTRTYSFSMASPGGVTATLQSMSGAGVPANVVVNMGIGTPVGTTCTGNQSAVQATGDEGFVSQVSLSPDAGTYCVSLSDIGNLPAPATFRIQIDHP